MTRAPKPSKHSSDGGEVWPSPRLLPSSKYVGVRVHDHRPLFPDREGDFHGPPPVPGGEQELEAHVPLRRGSIPALMLLPDDHGEPSTMARNPVADDLPKAVAPSIRPRASGSPSNYS